MPTRQRSRLRRSLPPRRPARPRRPLRRLPPRRSRPPRSLPPRSRRRPRPPRRGPRLPEIRKGLCGGTLLHTVPFHLHGADHLPALPNSPSATRLELMTRPGLLEPSTGPPAISRTRIARRRTPSATQTDLRSADHVGVPPHTPTATPRELASQRVHPTARSP